MEPRPKRFRAVGAFAAGAAVALLGVHLVGKAAAADVEISVPETTANQVACHSKTDRADRK